MPISLVIEIITAVCFFTHDIILLPPKIRICLLITGVVSLILCYNFENAINIWYVFGSIGASSILIPFLGLLFINDYNVKYESIVILLPLIISSIWFMYGAPFGIDPLFPGILISILLNLLLFNKNKTY